jgi:hypothetical protein
VIVSLVRRRIQEFFLWIALRGRDIRTFFSAALIWWMMNANAHGGRVR